MRGCPVAAALLAALALTAPALAAFPPKGVAALGDSLTDPPAGLWPGILAAERGVNFGGPGNPYNLAVSGATAASLLSGGQHADARALIAGGEADAAFLWIGGNDVRAQGFALPVAQGTLAGAALAAKLQEFAEDVAAAAEEVDLARPRGLVLSAVPDVTLTPGAIALVPSAALRMRVADAIDDLNALLRARAESRGWAFLDDAALQREIQSGPLTVGGVPISLGQGTGGKFLYRDPIHPGAVGQAIVANARIAAMNRVLGAGLAPLSDAEILEIAGLGAEYAGETLSARIDYGAYLAVPPSTIDFGCGQGGAPAERRLFLGLGACAPFLLLARRRIFAAGRPHGRRTGPRASSDRREQ